MTATTYLHNLEMRRNTPFVIIEGKGFYRVNDELISPEVFEKSYPLPLYVRPAPTNFKGVNPDHTKDWLRD
jgi:hypothetical protein